MAYGSSFGNWVLIPYVNYDPDWFSKPPAWYLSPFKCSGSGSQSKVKLKRKKLSISNLFINVNNQNSPKRVLPPTML